MGEFLAGPPDDCPPRPGHAALARRLRTRPGMWYRIGQYASRNGAQGAASDIRSGRTPAWRPRGEYLAEAVTTEAGAHEVWASYTGPGPARKGPAQ